MFKKSILFAVFICLNSFAQHNFSTYYAHKSLERSIRVSDDIIEGRTAFFERQADEKPLMFQKTRVRIAELNRLSNNLSKFIVNTQEEVNSERVLYNLLDEDFYKKILFKNNGNLTKRGNQLKVKIDSLYTISAQVNVHRLSQLENFYEDHFKTNGEYYDHDGNKISYFEQLFYDKSNYGIMMSMNYLLLDVKTYQLLYYGTVMSY
ncbi:hypothetical protein EV195_108186 [Tenacibaculum skagerrakense]|uniref:GldM-like protein n=1 Tax=Tenacibaculum skagerrakense TaxID=186571 RepID=A0A4R2NPH3_9FLAO|nr:hypothetical protein [Tenacibaculum skagerrakense]TCP23713.1 hypothetical protein EV195_108186 [Tenacibaculum skagerrakense]